MKREEEKEEGRQKKGRESQNGNAERMVAIKASRSWLRIQIVICLSA